MIFDGNERLTASAQIYDTAMFQAVNTIKSTYGHTVSLLQKAKSLGKFGYTGNADNGVRTTVATFGSVATVNVNETYSTTNDIDKIVSSSGSDTETITLEGHTIDGSGNLTFAVQDVTLTGQTAVTLTTPLARASRAYVKAGTFASPASDLVGDIYVFASSGVTVTNGVPQTSTAVKLRIPAGKNQTEKAATSISSTDYWILTGVKFGLARDVSTALAEFEVEQRVLGGVWRPFGSIITLSTNQAFIYVPYNPYRIVTPNTDVRAVVTATANDTKASALIEGYLVTIE